MIYSFGGVLVHLSIKNKSAFQKHLLSLKSACIHKKASEKAAIPTIMFKMFYKCFYVTHHSIYFLPQAIHFGVTLVVSGAFVLHLILECNLL